MGGRPAKSLWWNIGAMLGNIASGVRADPKNPPARLYAPPPPSPPPPPPPPPRPVPPPVGMVSQRVQEARVQTPTGPVTLRRTITDEVVPAPPAPPSRPPGAPPQ